MSSSDSQRCIGPRRGAPVARGRLGIRVQGRRSVPPSQRARREAGGAPRGTGAASDSPEAPRRRRRPPAPAAPAAPLGRSRRCCSGWWLMGQQGGVGRSGHGAAGGPLQRCACVTEMAAGKQHLCEEHEHTMSTALPPHPPPPPPHPSLSAASNRRMSVAMRAADSSSLHTRGCLQRQGAAQAARAVAGYRAVLAESCLVPRCPPAPGATAHSSPAHHVSRLASQGMTMAPRPSMLIASCCSVACTRGSCRLRRRRSTAGAGASPSGCGRPARGLAGAAHALPLPCEAAGAGCVSRMGRRVAGGLQSSRSLQVQGWKQK